MDKIFAVHYHRPRDQLPHYVKSGWLVRPEQSKQGGERFKKRLTEVPTFYHVAAGLGNASGLQRDIKGTFRGNENFLDLDCDSGHVYIHLLKLVK